MASAFQQIHMYNLKTFAINQYGQVKHLPTGTIKETIRRRNGLMVKLSGAWKNVAILVATTFMPPPDYDANEYKIVYKNGDKYDPELTNLGWVCRTMRGQLHDDIDTAEDDKRYLVGVLEGDGHLQLISRPNRPVIKYAIVVTQAQNVGIPLVLLFMQKITGGNIRINAKAKGKRRKVHALALTQPKIVICLLEWISEYGVLKYVQAQYILNLLEQRPNMDFPKAEANEITRVFRRMHRKSEYQKVAIAKHNVVPAWIGGFADAEGCFRLDKDNYLAHVTISQENSPQILFHLQSLYGGNVVTNSKTKKYVKINWAAQDQCYDMLGLLQPYIKGKFAQLEYTMEAARVHLEDISFRGLIDNTKHWKYLQELYEYVKSLKYI